MKDIKRLSDIKPLAAKSLIGKKLDENQKLKISVICKYSEHNRDLYFCNKVSSKDLATSKRTAISTILRMDGKEMNAGDIPIKDDGTLEDNKTSPGRISKILDLYHVEFEEDMILKALYREKESINEKLKGDTLRFFYRIKEKTLEIVLIDPHHLVATELYVKYYKQNLNKYVYCISQLKKSIFD